MRKGSLRQDPLLISSDQSEADAYSLVLRCIIRAYSGLTRFGLGSCGSQPLPVARSLGSPQPRPAALPASFLTTSPIFRTRCGPSTSAIGQALSKTNERMCNATSYGGFCMHSISCDHACQFGTSCLLTQVISNRCLMQCHACFSLHYLSSKRQVDKLCQAATSGLGLLCILLPPDVAWQHRDATCLDGLPHQLLLRHLRHSWHACTHSLSGLNDEIWVAGIPPDCSKSADKAVHSTDKLPLHGMFQAVTLCDSILLCKGLRHPCFTSSHREGLHLVGML